MLQGRAREMGMAGLHTVSLSEVREQARGCRALKLEGQLTPFSAAGSGGLRMPCKGAVPKPSISGERIHRRPAVRSVDSAVVQEPSVYLAFALDFNDAAVFKRERMVQGIARRITHLDPTRSAM